MAKEITRTYISDAQLKAEYMKLFEAGNTDNSNTYERIRTKYKLAKYRHVETYHKTLAEWQILREKATDEQIHSNTRDELKSGLKSKIEWVAQLQKELDADEVTETIWDFKNGCKVDYPRKMTPAERKGHVERISKMMGFEASIKQEVAVTDKTIAVKYTD